MMEAIVLAGGFGTRLRHVVSDVPKPMAPVCGKPFLQYILDSMIDQGIEHIVLAVGYKWEIIANYFGESYRGVKLEYSVENEPLFTGGAIKQALSCCKEDDVFIFNGDTFFDLDLKALRALAEEKDADLVLAGKKMYAFERYGTVDTDETGKIAAFVEKQYCAEGIINGGVYYMRRRFLQTTVEKKFSFEEHTLKQRVTEGKMYVCWCNGYFIDIGIPEDYAKAQQDFQA